MTLRSGAWFAIFFNHFMGESPQWYKKTMLFVLGLNPLLLFLTGPFVTGWVILLEFIATLALALKCYPLLPGGLLALQITVLGLVTPKRILTEVEHNLEVILLLMFMVAGIYFMKDFLSWVFTKILFSTRSKIKLSLMFSLSGAFLSAWLDALTVTAVMIAVGLSFYDIYNQVSYEERVPGDYSEDERRTLGRQDLEQFDGFLRNLLMHGAVGTALGGVATLVGEPQNLLIGHLMEWSFGEFYLRKAHVSIPILLAGLGLSMVLEKSGWFGYGYPLPERVRNILLHHAQHAAQHLDSGDIYRLWVQALGAVWLIVALAFHLAAVGLIGLSVIVFLTTLTGKSEEHQIGKAFEEALPFTALLVVFFAMVGMIQTSKLFLPMIESALKTSGTQQLYAFFFASGVLSAVSDNVFVATVYIQEAFRAFEHHLIDRTQLEHLALAINVGTNIPSVATPNGQAAFLFLLTSGLAGRIKLSYWQMVKMAFPYAVLLTLVALLFLNYHWLPVPGFSASELSIPKMH